MKKIIYYITDHGKGHATRSVAIIRKLQELNVKVVIRNSNATDFLRKSLPNTTIISGTTDVGTSIKDNGISIDKTMTKRNMKRWIQKLNDYADIESKLINKINPNLVISDISAMPFIAAKKTSKPSLAISNFSWYDILKFLPEQQLEKIKLAYSNADLAIQLPLGTTMKHFKLKKRTGLVSRIPRRTRQEVRKLLKISDSQSSVLFALGGSKNKVVCKADKNIKILSMNTLIKNNLQPVYLTNWIEGQEIVSVSDLVICKCGYGFISECLTNGIPFYYVSDDDHLEQKAISDELIKHGIRNKITFEEINELNLTQEYIQSRQYIKKQPIDTDNVIGYIFELLKN